MRVASDSDADLDLWSDAVSEEEETVTGQSEITEGVEKDETRERCAKHPRSEFRSHNQKTAISQKDEARRKKIEAGVERAAKGPWDHKDDFLIFASLGNTWYECPCDRYNRDAYEDFVRVIAREAERC